MRELQAMFMECIIERNRIVLVTSNGTLKLKMEHCRKLG